MWCACIRTGVMAGKAAGMGVVAVPSMRKQAPLFNIADEVINSLLDLQPEKWGLPPFQDCIPLEPKIIFYSSISLFYLPYQGSPMPSSF